MHAGYLPAHYAEVDKQHDRPGWYFWDESEAWAVGPYETFEAAERARKEYRP